MRLPSRRLLSGFSLAVMVLFIIAAALIARPWAGSREALSLDDLGPDSITVFGGDSVVSRPATRAELEATYPLSIEFPRSVPPGYRLGGATMFLAPYPLLPPGVEVGVTLIFGNEHDLAQLQFSQAPGGRAGSGESLDRRTFNTEVVGRDAAGHATLQRRALSWERCGRLFALHSIAEEPLDEPSLIRIAESVGPDACE